jgi:transposase
MQKARSWFDGYPRRSRRSRGAERWNDSGVGDRPLDHGGARPSNLREAETRTVSRAAQGGQMRTIQGVLHLSEVKFGVTYHPNYM